ncbi:MAG: hypothetical protein O2780_04985 [Proteobacteria bacterium]|jgi:hypothetical protein|nr:hypothetical protein [Pseudomonadota bacterium]MDA1301740.1 hypothetical protein [Pseudomonadota bacterium]
MSQRSLPGCRIVFEDASYIFGFYFINVDDASCFFIKRARDRQGRSRPASFCSLIN